MRCTRLLTILFGSLLAGCQGGASTSSSLPLELDNTYARDAGVGDAYRLTKDATINGQPLTKGTFVYGVPVPTENGRTEWSIKPEFEELKGDPQFIFGRRFGASTFVRFDRVNDPPHEEPTPFTKVVLYYANGPDTMVRSRNDRWFGVVEGARTISLLNEAGQVQATFGNVSDLDPKKSIELLPGGGALLVHGNGFDRVYDKTGKPMGPEVAPLASLVRTKPNGHMMPDVVATVFGVRLDAEKGRYWLLLDDGRMFPKPDDCLGVQPLLARDELNIPYWRGWLVWWKTPAGERASYLEPSEPTDSYEKLMASRSQAKWVEWTTYYEKDYYRFDDIRRSENTNDYELIYRDEPIAGRRFASVTEATTLLKKLQTEAAAESLKRMQDYEKAKAAAKAEAERQAYAQRAAEATVVTESAQSGFDTAMQNNQKLSARYNLLRLQTDPERWTAYVKQYGLDPGAANDSNSVGYARAKLGGTDADVLEKAVQDAKPKVTYEEPQSDWDYFFNGPRGGYTPSHHDGYQVDQRLVGQGFIDHQESIRRQNQDAWLRGAQNWK